MDEWPNLQFSLSFLCIFNLNFANKRFDFCSKHINYKSNELLQHEIYWAILTSFTANFTITASHKFPVFPQRKQIQRRIQNFLPPKTETTLISYPRCRGQVLTKNALLKIRMKLYWAPICQKNLNFVESCEDGLYRHFWGLDEIQNQNKIWWNLKVVLYLVWKMISGNFVRFSLSSASFCQKLFPTCWKYII